MARIPLFPLPGAILFPRMQLPLHIFEPRYRQMVEDAQSQRGQIGMIQPSGQGSDSGDPPPLYRAGCLGDIVAVEELADGNYNIVLEGVRRFALIAEVDSGTLYRQADVDLTAFDDSDPDALPMALRSAVEDEARRFGEALGVIVDWNAVGQLDDEMLVNAIAQVSPFDHGAKQALLEAGTLRERADLVMQLMQFQRLALGGSEGGATLQ